MKNRNEVNMNKYEMVIGLEVHVELATKTKIFCGCSTEFGAKVNSHTCPVCTGMPGTLPVLNKKVLEYAMAVGLATNCEITKYSKFDRKNYFYPDNPQNYQISQLYLPICRDGYIEIKTDNGAKKVGIHEIHMEEDAGKLVHDEENDCSLIDYNRAGVPLIEIVSEPDMRTSEEVISYIENLKQIMEYLEVSDCKLNEGSMRADINLSVREMGTISYGTRTEMKNLNSFKAISRAIEHEAKRQIDIIESGNKVTQETRRWDDTKGCSFSMRSKEDSNDYRYFPEPDLVPIIISDEWINEIRGRQPELRTEKMLRYKEEYNLPDYDIDIITASKKMADLYENVVAKGVNPKKVSNWLMGETFRLIRDRGMEPGDIKFSAENLAKLINLVEENKITNTVAKEVFEKVFDDNINPEEYVKAHGLMLIDNTDELISVIEEVFKNNTQSVEDYKNGKTKAMGYLVGQTMKAMKGKAAPDKINKLIKEKLDSLCG